MKRKFLVYLMLAIFIVLFTVTGEASATVIGIKDHNWVYVAGDESILDYTNDYIFEDYSSWWPQYGIHCNGWSSAELSSGTLKAYAWGISYAQSTAGYSDRFHLEGTSATIGEAVIILYLNGVHTLGGFVKGELYLLDSNGDRIPGYSSNVSDYNGGPQPTSVSLTVPFSMGQTSFYFSAYLTAGIKGGNFYQSSNFTQTATVDIILPEGVSGYTDQLQTLSHPIVPIPAAGWLLGTGLTGLLALRRHRKKRGGKCPMII